MTTFFNLTASEQELIHLAYEFEKKAIENGTTDRNPYADALRRLGLWEALNESVEMAFN